MSASGTAIDGQVFLVEKVLFDCDARFRLKSIKLNKSYHACECCEVKRTRYKNLSLYKLKSLNGSTAVL